MRFLWNREGLFRGTIYAEKYLEATHHHFSSQALVVNRVASPQSTQ
jgi:hypothetical protein